MSAPVQLFDFETQVEAEHYPCSCCKVYQSSIAIVFYTSGHLERSICLCRSCLRRMRATLKEAEKALPALPKRGVAVESK